MSPGIWLSLNQVYPETSKVCESINSLVLLVVFLSPANAKPPNSGVFKILLFPSS